ncbi:MAG: Nicotinamidase [Chlamydiia bacterium]|nr:Nicotinamidase [Chlamydiia bacterium]
MSKKALIIVDVQNDFLPGGSLAVKDGDQILPVIIKLMPQFDEVITTQDFHPEGHASFEKWPPHCVAGTLGAELSSVINPCQVTYRVKKGTNQAVDAYSPFFNEKGDVETDLHEYLRGKGIDTLYVVGLATDYCVVCTVCDALKLGYRVFLVEDGVRGVDLNAGDVKRALDEMASQGAELVLSEGIR